MTLTQTTVNTVRHETLMYEFDGELTEDEALEEIESGNHDPMWSKIDSEDIDVVSHEHLATDDAPVCEDDWDDRLESPA